MSRSLSVSVSMKQNVNCVLVLLDGQHLKANSSSSLINLSQTVRHMKAYLLLQTNLVKQFCLTFCRGLYKVFFYSSQKFEKKSWIRITLFTCRRKETTAIFYLPRQNFEKKFLLVNFTKGSKNIIFLRKVTADSEWCLIQNLKSSFKYDMSADSCVMSNKVSYFFKFEVK